MKRTLIVTAIIAAAALLFAAEAFAGWIDGYRPAGAALVLPFMLRWLIDLPGALWSRRRPAGPGAVEAYKLYGLRD